MAKIIFGQNCANFGHSAKCSKKIIDVCLFVLVEGRICKYNFTNPTRERSKIIDVYQVCGVVEPNQKMDDAGLRPN